jgi:hypothetical protein
VRRLLEAQDELTREALRRISESRNELLNQLVTEQSRASLEAVNRAIERNSRFAQDAVNRLLSDIGKEQLRELSHVMEGARAAAVINLYVGFAEVVAPAIPVEDRPLVDGVTAVPLVHSGLCLARRRDLSLRLAALALSAYVLVAALAEDSGRPSSCSPLV